MLCLCLRENIILSKDFIGMINNLEKILVFCRGSELESSLNFEVLWIKYPRFLSCKAIKKSCTANVAPITFKKLFKEFESSLICSPASVIS